MWVDIPSVDNAQKNMCLLLTFINAFLRMWMISKTIDIATVKGVDVTNLLRMRTVFKSIDNADIKRVDATKSLRTLTVLQRIHKANLDRVDRW